MFRYVCHIFANLVSLQMHLNIRGISQYWSFGPPTPFVSILYPPSIQYCDCAAIGYCSGVPGCHWRIHEPSAGQHRGVHWRQLHRQSRRGSSQVSLRLCHVMEELFLFLWGWKGLQRLRHKSCICKRETSFRVRIPIDKCDISIFQLTINFVLKIKKINYSLFPPNPSFLSPFSLF